MARVAKEITDKSIIDTILNVASDDISTSFIMNLFGEFNGVRRCQPYDYLSIPPNTYGPEGKKNKNLFVTTAGKFLFNRYFIESSKDIFDIIGWVDEDVNSGVFKKINGKLTYALIEDKITSDEFKDFVQKGQKCMPYVSILSPSYTDVMLTISKPINKRKDELFKENKAAIDAGDIYVVDKISNELLAYARELLKDDPSMDMYNSGARGTFENNFKNMFVMRGIVSDPDPTKGYNIITSNYIDGVSKDEYSMLANTLAAGPYARSKKTELGGYWEKLFLSAFQHIILLDEGSDCGTTRTITVSITNKNIKDLMYNYVVSGDKLIEITSENMNKFIGKTVKMRFASMCESKNGICNKCAGNLWYRIGVRNAGAATPQIPSRIKLLSMKLFHDSQVEFTEMDPMHAFSLD